MAVYTLIQAMKAATPVIGNTPPSYNFTESTSVANLVGAPMVFSSGLLVEASSNPDGVVVGLAEQAGLNISPQPTLNGFRVILAIPGTIFEANLAATTSSDPDVTHTLAATDVGTKFGIAKGTTSSLWYVDFSNTTNLRVVVIGLKDPIGTISGRVYFMWLLNGNGTGHATLFS